MKVYQGIDWTSDKDLKQQVGGSTDRAVYGWLKLYATGERLRVAMPDEALASADAADFDDGEGLIAASVDGNEEWCYVE